MLCYVMLCYVMLCYVMLCYVMLCYVIYVMLCYVMSTFHTTFVQMGEFDWWLGRRKGSIFIKMFKNLFLETIWG